MTVEITKGVGVQLTPALARSGVREDFSTASSVKACITGPSGTPVYATDTLQRMDAPDADWRNGEVTIEFGATATEDLPLGGTVVIGVTRYDQDSDGNESATRFWPVTVRVRSKC